MNPVADLPARIHAKDRLDAAAVVGHHLRIGRAEAEPLLLHGSLGHQVAKEAGELGGHVGRILELPALDDEVGSE